MKTSNFSLIILIYSILISLSSKSQTSHTWLGSVSSDWGNSTNWSSGIVPQSNDNIIISNSSLSNLILDQDRTIVSIQLLSSSSKKVELGDYNLTATSISGFSLTSYIKSSGIGKLSLSAPVGIDIIFPVGNTTYDPVKIRNNTGVNDVFSVRVIDAVFVNGLNGVTVSTPVVNRTWDISKSTPNVSPGVKLTFYWYDVSKIINGSISNPRLNHHNGLNWEIATVNTWTAGINPIEHTVTGYTGTFSPFTIAEGTSALPIELTAFNANCTEIGTTINWQTASEHNSAFFDVEKSRDGINWSVVETTAAAGNSTTLLDYSVVDSEKVTDVVYYRLNQIDQDGASKIFGPISANCFDTKDFTATVFPNPASGMVTIEMNAPKAQTVSIHICGTDGKAIMKTTYTLEAGTTQIPLSVESLKAGVYTVKVQGENSLKTIKLVVQ
jgi:hypothetical protein